MTRHRHGIALAVCAIMVLSMIVFSAFVAHEAAHPHPCTGEDCPICQFIAQVEQVRRGFGLLLLALLLVCLALSVRRARRAEGQAVPFGLDTLVRRKIRLNN